jgi:hypothetical protein
LNSPYINHFLSPDSIIPDRTNPQGLNRYSYVNNNPIKLTDPTGHRCVGKEGECEGENGKKGHGFGIKTPQAKQKGTGGCGGNAARNCDGTPTASISGAPTSITNQSTNGSDDFHSLSSYLQFMNNAIDFVDSLGRGTTLFEKGFLWGKAVNPDPRTDFVLGALGQGLADLDNPSLSVSQRAARAGVVGLESTGTGLLSDLAGGLGFLAGEAIVPEGGGVVGFALFAVPTSVAIDTKWSNYNNHTLFQNSVFSSP